ncbi:MAG: P1 family peptidase [Bryobacteraceae bacterium]
MKGLTDIPGIHVGHASDYEALTGCTVILCEGGAVAGGDIRGFATGTEEFEVLNPLHLTPQIHGVVFAGGSAFGLEAVSGVRKFLEQKGVGFDTGRAKVPIVPGAILYDLGIGKAHVRPTREMGEAAAAAATAEAVKEGNVGAGTGATVGKVYGMGQAMKSGVGSFTVAAGGANSRVLVAALAVVNAVGDVIDYRSGKILAGTRKTRDSKEFLNSAEAMKNGAQAGFRNGNTTLVVVATNAGLTKVQATRLAQLSQHGVVRAISPVNTLSDGDIAIALSAGAEQADFNAVGIAAGEAVAEAILRAVRSAGSLGGLPGLKD